MDGFNQDEHAGESGDGCEVLFGFFASHGDALEALDLANELLDASAQPVEVPGEKARLPLGILAMWDDRTDAARACRLAIDAGIIALVADHPARRHLGSDVEQRLELPAVTRLIAGEVEVERIAREVAFEVDLGSKAATGAAERLILLPPLAPAAETWARMEVLSNICTRPAVRLASAKT